MNNFQVFYDRLRRLTRSGEPPLCLFLSLERLRGRRSRDRSRPSFLSRSPRDRSRRSLSSRDLSCTSRLSPDRSLSCERLLRCLDGLRSLFVPFLAGGSGDFFLLSSSSLLESFLFAFLCFFFSFFSFFFFFFFFSSLNDRTASSSSSSSSELPDSLTEIKRNVFFTS